MLYVTQVKLTVLFFSFFSPHSTLLDQSPLRGKKLKDHVFPAQQCGHKTDSSIRRRSPLLLQLLLYEARRVQRALRDRCRSYVFSIIASSAACELSM